VAHGPDHGAFFHKFFRRDQPHLVAQMYCKNARSKLAMASDEAEKKAKSMARLKTNVVKPILPRAPIMAPALPPNSRISSLNGGLTWTSSGSSNLPSEMRPLEKLALNSSLLRPMWSRELPAPPAPVLLPNKVNLGAARICGADLFAPMNLSFEMLLQLEKVQQNSLLLERALKMPPERSLHGDRLLQLSFTAP
jgi:hypothetical protein